MKFAVSQRFSAGVSQEGGLGGAHTKKQTRGPPEVPIIAIQGTSQLWEGRHRMEASALEQECKHRIEITVPCPAGLKPADHTRSSKRTCRALVKVYRCAGACV